MRLRKQTLFALAVFLPACAGNPPPSGPGPGDAPPWVCGSSQASGYISVPSPLVDDQGRPQMIVRLQPGAPAALGVSTLQATVQTLAQEFQVQGLQTMASGFVGFLAADQGRALAQRPGVMYVQEVGVKSVPPPGGVRIDDVGPAAVPWHVDRPNQRALPLDGNGVYPNRADQIHVFVIDTGVDCDRIDGTCGDGWSAYGGEPTDGHGHGTFVAGEIADATFGISPGVSIHPVRVLTSEGTGSDQAVRHGWDWVIQYVTTHGLGGRAVISASLGGSVAPFIDEGVCAANDAGIVNVVAAGNDGDALGRACDGSPARVDVAFTVGASDRSDEVARFSSFGSCVDIHAPGVDVDSVNGSGWNGTSMATPCVAAVVAQLLNAGKPAQAVVDRATQGVLTGLRGGSPNRLLYGGPED